MNQNLDNQVLEKGNKPKLGQPNLGKQNVNQNLDNQVLDKHMSQDLDNQVLESKQLGGEPDILHAKLLLCIAQISFKHIFVSLWISESCDGRACQSNQEIYTYK